MKRATITGHVGQDFTGGLCLDGFQSDFPGHTWQDVIANVMLNTPTGALVVITVETPGENVRALPIPEFGPPDLAMTADTDGTPTDATLEVGG